MNQQCPQYGKLLCNGCTVEVPLMGDCARQKLVEPGKTIRVVPGKIVLTVFVIVTGIGFGAGVYFGMPWLGAMFGGAIIAGIVSAWLVSLKENLEPICETITETVEVGRQKSCIACRQAVGNL
jgi:hypothetical protein